MGEYLSFRPDEDTRRIIDDLPLGLRSKFIRAAIKEKALIVIKDADEGVEVDTAHDTTEGIPLNAGGHGTAVQPGDNVEPATSAGREGIQTADGQKQDTRGTRAPKHLAERPRILGGEHAGTDKPPTSLWKHLTRVRDGAAQDVQPGTPTRGTDKDIPDGADA